MITLKVSGKKILQSVGRILIFSIAFLGFAYGFFPPFDGKIQGVLLLYSIGAVPNMILLTEYLIHTLKIDHIDFEEGSFKLYYKNGMEYDYKYSDIEVINLYKAAGMDKGNYAFNSNERYYYACLRAKNGTNIILTSLLGPDLSDALDMMIDVPVDRTKTGYAFIFRNN